MPLTESQKSNLKEFGKFNIHSIQWFDRNNIDYDIIKELQETIIKDSLHPEDINYINQQVEEIIRFNINEAAELDFDVNGLLKDEIRRLNNGRYGGKRIFRRNRSRSRRNRSRRKRSRRNRSRSRRRH